MVKGELYRFTEYDGEDKNIYLHYMEYDEVITFIEVHFLVSGADDMRKQYNDYYRRDVLNDYYNISRPGAADFDKLIAG